MAWARPTTTGPLAPPCRYQCAYDATPSTLYVHGGGGQGSLMSQRRSMLWALDLRTLRWSVLDGPRKTPVTARKQHALTVCGKQLVVFGGQGEGINSVDWTKERSTAGAGQPVVRMRARRAADWWTPRRRVAANAAATGRGAAAAATT